MLGGKGGILEQFEQECDVCKWNVFIYRCKFSMFKNFKLILIWRFYSMYSAAVWKVNKVIVIYKDASCASSSKVMQFQFVPFFLFPSVYN